MNGSRIKSTGDADTYTPHKQLHARYKFLSKHVFKGYYTILKLIPKRF